MNVVEFEVKTKYSGWTGTSEMVIFLDGECVGLVQVSCRIGEPTMAMAKVFVNDGNVATDPAVQTADMLMRDVFEPRGWVVLRHPCTAAKQIDSSEGSALAGEGLDIVCYVISFLRGKVSPPPPGIKL